MEYVQMTLNDWIEIKQKLKQELLRRYVCTKRVLHVYKSGDEWRN